MEEVGALLFAKYLPYLTITPPSWFGPFSGGLTLHFTGIGSLCQVLDPITLLKPQISTKRSSEMDYALLWGRGNVETIKVM